MVILPFVLHSLKLRIYGPFYQNLKAFHTFCNSESSLFLEKLLLCCLCHFPTFFVLRRANSAVLDMSCNQSEKSLLTL